MQCTPVDDFNTVIIASYVVSVDEVLPAKANGGAYISKLLKWAEERNSRLVMHAEWAVRVKQCMIAVILVNGTYKFALLLVHVVHTSKYRG